MEKHIRILGYLFIVWGIVIIAVALISLFVPMHIRGEIRTPAGPIGMIVISAIVTAFYIYSGWALITRQPWARVAAIVASIWALFSFPIGTAIGIYGLWVAFSEAGRRAFGSYIPPESPPTPGGAAET